MIPSARSDLLDKYLRDDPGNPQLLGDAFDAALAAGLHDRALAYVHTAQRLQLDPSAWTFRQASVCIAKRDLQQAQALLEDLRATRGEDPAISHDLAFVRFLQGDLSGCRTILAAWLDGSQAADSSLPADQAAALQALWLRASHHLRMLDEAWQWVQARRAAGTLTPAAAGVASLMAVDLGFFEDALALSEVALAQDPGHMEALVARGSAALAQRQPAAARECLYRALERNPDDGRTWSAIGFATMLELDLPTAQAQFERALVTMPGHIGTWHGLGWCRLQQKDIPGAFDAFQRALELDRNFAESHGAVGVALVLAGKTADADEALRRAEKLDPDSVSWRYGRALMAGEISDASRLQQLALRLLERPGPFGGRLSDWLKAPKP